MDHGSFGLVCNHHIRVPISHISARSPSSRPQTSSFHLFCPITLSHNLQRHLRKVLDVHVRVAREGVEGGLDVPDHLCLGVRARRDGVLDDPRSDEADIGDLILEGTEHQTEAVKALIELDAALQKAQFRTFWEKAGSAECRKVLDKVPGFDEAIRVFILGALGRTYQKVEAGVLAAALNISDGAGFAASKGWTVEGSLVTLPPSAETSARPKTKEVEGLALGMPALVGGGGGGAGGNGASGSSSSGGGAQGGGGGGVAPMGGTTLAGLLTTLGRTL
jgi:hypothetical protein